MKCVFLTCGGGCGTMCCRAPRPGDGAGDGTGDGTGAGAVLVQMMVQ